MMKIFYYCFLFAMFTAFSIGVTNIHQRVIDLPNKDARIQIHTDIITSQAKSPYRYRVLFPYVTEWIVDSIIPVNVIDINTKLDPNFPATSLPAREFKFVQTWYLLEVIILFFVFANTFLFLNRFPLMYRIAGCLFLYTALNAAFIGHAYQPWSMIEAALFPLAFFVMSKIKSPKDFWWLLAYLVILVTACFNRETGIFIAAFFVITVLLRKEIWKFKVPVILVTFIGLAILGGLRIWKGYAESELSIPQIYQMNLAGSNTNLMMYELKNMFSIFWLGIIIGLLKFKKEWWNYLLLIILYLPFYVVFGLWAETRLLLPILSILIFALLYFFEQMEMLLQHHTLTNHSSPNVVKEHRKRIRD